MTTYHPWRNLRAHPEIDVIWPEIEIFGQTDGTTIQIDSRLGQTERRCTLEHEMQHVAAGHRCGQSESMELSIRQVVARRLVPISILAQALAYSLNLDEVAEDVWVTREVLDDRMAYLTEHETAEIYASTRHHRDDQ
jgi:hypothetical protein